MDLIDNLALGFSVAATAQNLALCFVGCLLGSAIGVLPGIGPLATMSMLLPMTFHLTPAGALIMLAGVYYGAQYGGSTTAILLNLPGESASVPTCLDGHAMARQGKGGVALATAALSSLLAGCIATVLLAASAPALAAVALRFQSADYVSILVLGLVAAIALSHGSVLKSIAAVLIGLTLGLVGTDVSTGEYRLTFGVPALVDGIGFVPVAMGLFGVAEIIGNLNRTDGSGVKATPVTRIWPVAAELRAMLAPALRGTALGAFFGILPGGGPTIGAFSAYGLEKKIAREPQRFGRGAIEGVAAPEAANNAAAQASFIPMLSLGVPPSALMALMIGAMMIHGTAPGPSFIAKQPALFWGLVVSMWIGNAMLVVLNLPLIKLWVRLLGVPYLLLYPAIVALCCIGTYTVSNSVADVVIMAVFGLAGWGFNKIGIEAAPLLMGLVLGPMLEENLRRAISVSGGFSIFFTRPISATLLACAAGVLLASALPALRRNRQRYFS
ncbi:tripartite tricarboxylate transporter permease [Ramlibacter tataouinensis]|uniref:tripartite tricarboxylate transporter permease n=1 Tax=Ramlibacter tataouinensis TaxID=94132 RepID=UPI0022F3BD55|nr:tripartite tricarboxylate transporter permease [Ramlibacter tataouinensis]WBY00562.1 tripartite tricarboxylate transporter permease [Ramlibacter tataouinensis]